MKNCRPKWPYRFIVAWLVIDNILSRNRFMGEIPFPWQASAAHTLPDIASLAVCQRDLPARGGPLAKGAYWPQDGGHCPCAPPPWLRPCVTSCDRCFDFLTTQSDAIRDEVSVNDGTTNIGMVFNFKITSKHFATLTVAKLSTVCEVIR